MKKPIIRHEPGDVVTGLTILEPRDKEYKTRRAIGYLVKHTHKRTDGQENEPCGRESVQTHAQLQRREERGIWVYCKHCAPVGTRGGTKADSNNTRQLGDRHADRELMLREMSLLNMFPPCKRKPPKLVHDGWAIK